MSPARLAAHALALLGPVAGPVAVVGRGASLAAAVGAQVAIAPDGTTAAGAVVSFLGVPAVPGERQLTLTALRGRLAPGAPVVLVDHNQPRGLPGRLLGAAGLLLRGLRAGRARYPAARELQALGFRVEALRLAAGECVQLVAARR